MNNYDCISVNIPVNLLSASLSMIYIKYCFCILTGSNVNIWENLGNLNLTDIEKVAEQVSKYFTCCSLNLTCDS